MERDPDFRTVIGVGTGMGGNLIIFDLPGTTGLLEERLNAMSFDMRPNL